jgi:hypothetical protein
MTAVAASLVIVLINRPEQTKQQRSIADGAPFVAAPRATKERSDGRAVLSTRDVRLPDIEQRLINHESDRSDGPSTPVNDRRAPVFTANAWHQVVNETESARPSQRDASGLLHNQGVNS